MDGREIRLRRLFGDGLREAPPRAAAVVVAMDHGMFDGPIAGMEDLPVTAARINPAVDAVLLSPGMLRHCGGLFAGRRRPLAVVRLNWNSVYCFRWNCRQAPSAGCYEAEDGLREGMDVALVSLTLQTGSEDRDAANVEVFARLTNACHRLGIPVIGEYFPTGHAEMSPELGADAIKTFCTCQFRAVTRACPAPVLGLGAERLPSQGEALALAASAMAAGAAGVVFGRNAIQVDDPFAFQAALCAVVREGADPAAAVEEYKLE